MTYTVRDFAFDVYGLINAHNPTTPLHGNDQNKCIQILNMLLQSYASSGLMLTIANTVTANVSLGNESIIFTAPDYVVTPTDPKIVQIAQGRLANLDSAWLESNGVTYPLFDRSRDEYLGSYKYQPLKGVPVDIIIFPQKDYVIARLFPAPSQGYQFFCRGKFQLSSLTSNDDMSIVPEYYHLYLIYAVAKYLCKFKGRGSAWTPDLESDYRELKDNMEGASEVNLSIVGSRDNMLWGANRVRAGV